MGRARAVSTFCGVHLRVVLHPDIHLDPARVHEVVGVADHPVHRALGVLIGAVPLFQQVAHLLGGRNPCGRPAGGLRGGPAGRGPKQADYEGWKRSKCGVAFMSFLLSHYMLHHALLP